jgi:hypothetical protein
MKSNEQVTGYRAGVAKAYGAWRFWFSSGLAAGALLGGGAAYTADRFDLLPEGLFTGSSMADYFLSMLVGAALGSIPGSIIGDKRKKALMPTL